VLVGSTIEPTEWGASQGSAISPLLSNILLDELDKELEARGHRFVRYVDDRVILVKSRRAGRLVMAKMSHYLSQKLKLKVNRQKSRVVKIEELNYLGFTFRGIRIFAVDLTNLLKLGTSQRHAILTGISRKGYWRLSKTLATHTGMTNEWLEQQGLLSIRTLWMKVQGYV
jgi:hypothetical protein